MVDQYSVDEMSVKNGFVEGQAGDLSHVIGEAVWVLGASERHSEMPVAKLRNCVFEPILLQQCIIFQNKGLPLAAAFWARQKRGWRAPANGLLGMERGDWVGGTLPVIVDIIAPFGDEAGFTEAVELRLQNEIQRRSAA